MVRSDPTFRRLSHADELRVEARLPWGYRYGALLLVGGALGAYQLGRLLNQMALATHWSFLLAHALPLYLALGLRNRLRIDLRRRDYRETKGLWPLVRRRGGSLETYERVELVRWRRSAADRLITRLLHRRSGAGFGLLLLVGEADTLLLDGRSPPDQKQRALGVEVAALLELELVDSAQAAGERVDGASSL